MRIGIDVGGTKIEALALDNDGRELVRHRVATPQGDYRGTIDAISALVRRIESETGHTGTVGAGIPGSLRANGEVKNSNSLCLNGRTLQLDLSGELNREVRVANDANCLAVSEATDGAAHGARTVFGVILGTGCGGGVALEGRVHAGPNGVAGEWGHNPLPWAKPDELPGPPCYCGRQGCLEVWLSGTGIAADHARTTGQTITTHTLAEQAEQGSPEALATLDRFEERLARSLAGLVNILDPDIIVFGGGVSRIPRIYANLPALIRPYVFGGDFDTPLVPATFGDSSGVRGAAWLWPATRGNAVS